MLTLFQQNYSLPENKLLFDVGGKLSVIVDLNDNQVISFFACVGITNDSVEMFGVCHGMKNRHIFILNECRFFLEIRKYTIITV